MASVALTDEALRRATAAFPLDTPLVMVNLLRFRDIAAYGDEVTGPPCSGRLAYTERYVPAFQAAAADHSGISRVYVGSVVDALVASAGERWDAVALVQYPSMTVVQAILGGARYRTEAEPHRLAALAEWRFFATQPGGL
jgi:hypothetical protein